MRLLIGVILLSISTAMLAQNSAPLSVTVIGQSQIKVKPDVIQMRVDVDVRETDQSQAKALLDKKVDGVLHFLKQFGLSNDDFSLEALYITPMYQEQGMGKRVSYYMFSKGIKVTLLQLDRFEALVDGLLKVGATNVGQIESVCSKEGLHRNEALVRAMANAKEKATLLATEANLKLGNVLQVYEGIKREEGPFFMAPSIKGESIQPDQIVYEASVTVTYELQQ